MHYLLPLLLSAAAFAEPILLRKAGNPAVVTFEYVTQDELTVTVQLPGKETLITYKWEELDLDFVKKTNPSVWAEHVALAKPEPEKKMKEEEPADPFAVAQAPTDAKSYLGSLQTALSTGLKGLPPAINVPMVCKEFDLEESVFWKNHDELRRISKNGGKPELGIKAIELTPPGSSEGPAKGKKGGKPQNRAADNATREAEAKKDYEADAKPFNGLGYLRMLAEGGSKMKFSWVMLRRANDDRRAILATLRQHEALAQEMADKTKDQSPPGRDPPVEEERIPAGG